MVPEIGGKKCELHFASKLHLCLVSHQVTELEWPLEMLQETQTEPPIVWSCNPLHFDFTQLFNKPQVGMT